MRNCILALFVQRWALRLIGIIILSMIAGCAPRLNAVRSREAQHATKDIQAVIVQMDEQKPAPTGFAATGFIVGNEYPCLDRAVTIENEQPVPRPGVRNWKEKETARKGEQCLLDDRPICRIRFLGHAPPWSLFIVTSNASLSYTTGVWCPIGTLFVEDDQIIDAIWRKTVQQQATYAEQDRAEAAKQESLRQKEAAIRVILNQEKRVAK